MNQFKSNLEKLPDIESVQSITLSDENNPSFEHIIENKPGKSGSLRVYYYLGKTHGAINSEAAKEGVDIFAKFSEEAKEQPGSHPNIDLLFDVINNSRTLTVSVEGK